MATIICYLFLTTFINSYEQLKLVIEEYIEYYNYIRRKEKLSGWSSIKYREMIIEQLHT